MKGTCGEGSIVLRLSTKYVILLIQSGIIQCWNFPASCYPILHLDSLETFLSFLFNMGIFLLWNDPELIYDLCEFSVSSFISPLPVLICVFNFFNKISDSSKTLMYKAENCNTSFGEMLNCQDNCVLLCLVRNVWVTFVCFQNEDLI